MGGEMGAVRQTTGWRLAGHIALVAVVIVLVCLSAFDDFFFVDDAQNEFLPFYREMGRLWLSGQLPILTTNSWLGGNILVDMVLSPFAPQTILASVVAASAASNAAAILTFTFFNLALVVASGWWLGRSFGLESRWGVLLGFLLATQPMFLYVLSATWWNSAGAYAWFVFAFAALLHLRREPGRWAFAASTLGACALLASASAQFHLAYGVTVVIVVVADFLERRDAGRSIRLLLAPACAVFIAAVPLMSEYVSVADLLVRVSGFHNRQDVLRPHWGMLVNTFNPYYGSYMAWWQGLTYMPVSLGYSTVLVFFALAYFRWRPPATVEQRVLAAFAVLALVLCLFPAQFGPLRVPSRFLPLLALSASVYSVQRMALGRVRIDCRRAMLGLGFAMLVAVSAMFSAEGDLRAAPPALRLQLALALIGGGVLSIAYLARRPAAPAGWFRWAATISFAAWFSGVMVTPTLTHVNFPHTDLPDADGIAATGRPGYMVSLCGAVHIVQARDMTDLASARFLLYGQRAINGYSPVGHRGFARHFPYGSPHGLFQGPAVLAGMSGSAQGLPGVSVHHVFQLSDIVACEKDVTAPVLAKMEAAGLKVVRKLEQDRVLIQPVQPLGASGSLLRTDGAQGVEPARPSRMTSERFSVPASEAPRSLYFSRLYWPGYSATLGGEPLRLSRYLSALIKVDVPAGRSGELELRYEPTTWRWTRWSLLFGILLAAATLLSWRAGRGAGVENAKSMPRD